MAWDFFRSKKQKKEVKALPDHSGDYGFAENEDSMALSAPQTARFGNSCETRTFLIDKDTGAPDTIQMQAQQMEDESWIVKTILRAPAVHQGLHDELDPDAMSVATKFIDTDLSFWQAIEKMAEFEVNALGPDSNYWPDGTTLEDMGVRHFKAFCEREGTIGFDALGQPHIAVEGVILDEGTFLEDDLKKLMAGYQNSLKAESEQKSAWNHNLLSSMFKNIAETADYQTIRENLLLKSQMEDYVASIEGALEVIEAFRPYFDGAFRQKTLEDWLAQEGAQYHRAILPGLLKEAGLSAQNVLESRAFESKKHNDPAYYTAFADALSRAARQETDSHEENFVHHYKQALATIDEIDNILTRSGLADEQAYNAETLGNVMIALEFTYWMMKAKARFAFVQHIHGDAAPHLDQLDEMVEKAQRCYKMLDAPESEVALIPNAVISGEAMEVPAMIKDFIADYRVQTDNLTRHINASREPQEQMPLPLTGGEAGLMPYKSKLSVEDLLENVRDEHARAMLKEFETEIQRAFNQHQKRYDYFDDLAKRQQRDDAPAGDKPAPARQKRRHGKSL